MKHAAAKKRRRQGKVKLRTQKHRAVRVANSITVASIKEVYDKTRSPAENLTNFGLMADANSIQKLKEDPIDKKKAAFIGYAEIPVPPKKKILSYFERSYIKACIDKHGDNFAAMFMDIKTNYNQHTEGRLQKMYRLYYDGEMKEDA